uniref:NAC domain-containing protein n=1 Tax=Oryza rufipogon TaxID=4529 RepID=A0A0E0QEA5_ORYRU
MADDVAPALLVDALLRRQHGHPLPPQLPFAIFDANVFASDPSTLYNEYWSYAADDGSIYLFSPGPSTEGQWRTATAARSITTADGTYIGRRTTWVIFDRVNGGWAMEEFCTYHNDGGGAPGRQPLPPLVQRRRQHQVGLEGQFSQMCSLR